MSFKIGQMKRELRLKDELLASRVDYVYEYAIDQGAHPNVRALIAHLAIDEPAGVAWRFVVSQSDGLRTIMLVLAMAGVTALDIFALCYHRSVERWFGTSRIGDLHRSIAEIVAACPKVAARP